MTIYQEFYFEYYTRIKDFLLNYYDGDYKLNASNYFEIIDNKIDISDEVRKVKELVKSDLPQNFIDFYSTCINLEHLQIPFSGICIAAPIYDYEAGSFLDYVSRYEEVLKYQLIPIGLYQDEWIICLNLSENNDKNNPPISLFESSLFDEPQKAISPKYWFSSFDKFIICMKDYIKNKDAENFVNLDSENNFRTAYSYWSGKT